MWFKKILTVIKGEEGIESELFATTNIYKKYEKSVSPSLDILITSNEKLMASQRFHEFAVRLDHRYINLKTVENIVSHIPDNIRIPVSEIQLEFVNRVEAYYQQLYASLSALAMLINYTAPHEFKRNLTIKSISAFLEFLSQKNIPIESEIKELKRAVEFRSKFVDHIQQHTLHNWMTCGVPINDVQQCVVIYFIDKGSERYAPKTGPLILDPYHEDFDPLLGHRDFYVSPPHDNCHKSFFDLTEKILQNISRDESN